MRTTFAALVALALLGCNPGPTAAPSASVPASVSPPSLVPTAPAPTASAAATTDVIHIPLSGAAPDAIVLDGSTAWVLAGEGGSLIEVDLVARKEVRAIDVGFGPTHVAMPTSDAIAVGRFDNSGPGSYLLIVDPATGAYRGVPTGELGAMTAGDEGIVWALEKADRLLKVDASGAKVTENTAVDVGQNVHVEVQWGAGSVWVGSDGLPVVRLNGETLEVEKTISVSTGIPFLFHDGLMWGAGPTELWAIDPATNEIDSHVPLANVSEILALDVDGTDAWLAVRHPGQVGAVLRLDLASGAVVDEFPVSLPAAVKLTPDRAWVASYLTNELLGFPR